MTTQKLLELNKQFYFMSIPGKLTLQLIPGKLTLQLSIVAGLVFLEYSLSRGWSCIKLLQLLVNSV